MLAFEGTAQTGEEQLILERTDLLRYGLSWAAVPYAFCYDNTWQVWWFDPKTAQWLHREPTGGVVQIPLTVVP